MTKNAPLTEQLRQGLCSLCRIDSSVRSATDYRCAYPFHSSQPYRYCVRLYRGGLYLKQRSGPSVSRLWILYPKPALKSRICSPDFNFIYPNGAKLFGYHSSKLCTCERAFRFYSFQYSPSSSQHGLFTPASATSNQISKMMLEYALATQALATSKDNFPIPQAF